MSGFRPRFFVEPQEAQPSSGDAASTRDGQAGRELVLSLDDSHHVLHVLRLKEGDECEVVVGGAVFEATVVSARRPVKVRLQDRLDGPGAGARYRVQVGLVQAIIRPALVDHVLEKATEVGASFFVLVLTTGSVRGAGRSGESRLARWERIVTEAAKQSKQTHVPEVALAGSVDEALGLLAHSSTRSLLLEPSAGMGIWDRVEPVAGRTSATGHAPTADHAPTVGDKERVALWVGPESGWTPAEVERLVEAGAEPVRLGRGVLRTETAGPVAVAVTRLLLRDW